MAEDIIKPMGATSASKNDAGGGVTRSEPVLAVVKNNIDPIRQGRLQVYIDDMNSPNPDDSNSWVTVSYMSPFYGKTTGGASSDGYGSYASNPISYGEWHSPPDIGTKVVCIFINGDPNYGYYIGCVPEPEALSMVPAIGAVDAKVTMNEGEAKGLAGATQLPITNLNTDNSGISEGNDFLSQPKPVHSYVASVLSQQGLIRDPIRGPITSSAQRESPSRVGWGVSTPGRPIYEGGFTDQTVLDATKDPNKQSSTKVTSRRAGHTFVMDDGDLLGKDQLIRLRTALGHQILMSDDGQCLFIIHANGQSWIELGKEGTIDMFSTNSVNVRTQGDLNLHADNNVNIHADKSININAKESININSDKETSVRTGTDFKHEVLSNFTTKVGSGMSMSAGGEGSYASSGTMYVNGSKINLNTGQAGLNPSEVKPIPLIAQTDTLFDDEKGFAPVPGKTQTIVSRMPAHQPWAMANKGVDVKVDLSASSALPAAPSPAVTAANNSVPSTPDVPVTVATNATVPNLGSASEALGAGATSSLVGAVAAQAGAVAPAAVAAGTAITDGKAQIGQLAQSATQMVTGGSLKPGADTLVNGLISQGASVTGAMTNNMFTGQAGATNLQQFANSTTAQVKTAVSTLTQSQNQLTQTGVLSGKESPTAVAGLVMAGAQNGVGAVTNFVKNAAGSAAGQLASLGTQLDSKVSGIAQNISSGNFAGGLADKLTSGLGGIASSIGGAVDSAKGVVASAFKSITDGYTPFKPGVPQDLGAIAKETAAKAAAADAGSSSGLSGALSSVTGALSGATGSLANAVSGATGSVTGSLTSSLGGALSSATGAISGAVSSALGSVKSGLQGLAGGSSVLGSVVNNATGAINNLPGMSVLKSAIGNNSTSLLNNIPNPLASVTSQVNSIVGSATAGLSSLTSAAGSLTSGLTGGAGGLTSGLSSLTSGLKTGGLLSSATSLLPKGLASQLNSAISALSSNGPVSVKMPVIAENTVDRSGFVAQVSSILGNPKIPAPSYGSGGVASYYEQETAKLKEYTKKRDELSKKADDQYEIAMAAKSEYELALQNLPAGDPGILAAKEKFYAERTTWFALSKEVTDFIANQA